MSPFRTSAAMAAAQVYYRITGLLVLGVLSRTLSATELGTVLWAQALCDTLILLANLNLNPNLLRRVAATPQAASQHLSALFGLRVAGMAAYLSLCVGIALCSSGPARLVLLGLALEAVLEDCYFFFGALFIGLGQIHRNLLIGLSTQTLYVAAVCLGLHGADALTMYVLINVARGLLLLTFAIWMAQRCVPGWRIRWEAGLWAEQVPLLGTALLTALRGRAEILVASGLLGAAAAPLNLTQQIILAAGFLPAAALAGVAPTLAFTGKTPVSLKLTRQTTLLLGVVGLGLAGIMAFQPYLMSRLLFGPKIQVGVLLRLAAPLIPLLCLEGFAIGVLQTWRRERQVLVVGVTGLIFYLGLAVVFTQAFGITGLLSAQCIAALFRTGWLLWETLRT